MRSNNLLHLAIIADGNRRWAKANNKAPVAGYVQSLYKLFQLSEAAMKNNVSTLTLYIFSSDNWKRPKEEIDFLFLIIEKYLKQSQLHYADAGVKIKIIGRKDRIPMSLLKQIQETEELTKHNKNLDLNFCIDYDGKEEILQAVHSGAKTAEEVDNLISKKRPAPDIILRTGGERRLSNFLLWDSGYSELFFIDEPFPEISEQILSKVLKEYYQRNRTYGG